VANINSHWRKIMGAGCNHSVFACQQAQDAVLGFRERYKPDVCIDLGDVHDFTAFRSGAKGTKDESANVELDYQAGVEWLRRYHPTHRCNGNHDHRIYKLLDSNNAIVAHAAGKVAEDIRRVDAENGTVVRPYKRRENWFEFGGTLWGHGFMYNMQALRDHAEHFGQCVIAHLHTPGEARGRRLDRPAAWCVGTLADPSRLEYADMRRNTDTWAHGFIWGEFNDSSIVLRLERQECSCGNGQEEWRLPL
jgi:hypothetical protein